MEVLGSDSGQYGCEVGIGKRKTSAVEDEDEEEDEEREKRSGEVETQSIQSLG